VLCVSVLRSANSAVSVCQQQQQRRNAATSVSPFVFVFVFAFVCLLCCIRSFLPSFLRSFVCSFIRFFLRSFVCSFVPSFLHSFLHSFLPSFLPSFIRSFIRSFVLFGWLFGCLVGRLLFVRSFVRSFGRFVRRSFVGWSVGRCRRRCCCWKVVKPMQWVDASSSTDRKNYCALIHSLTHPEGRRGRPLCFVCVCWLVRVGSCCCVLWRWVRLVLVLCVCCVHFE